MISKTHQTAHPKRLIGMLIGLALGLTATPVLAATFPDKPLSWAKSSFSKHSESVEHITLRGGTRQGHETFIRWSMANAGYKKGKLTITFLQRAPGGSLYAKKEFKRGKYTVASDRLAITAQGNTLRVVDGKLKMHFDLGDLAGDAVLSSGRRGPVVRDRAGGGWIKRDLASAWGQLQVTATAKSGRAIDLKTTVFTVHEASNVKADRVYDRSVQFHSVRGGRMRVVDYIVGPKERAHRPLGFVIVRGGARFVGAVTAEVRSEEKLDSDNDYKVPWRIDITASAGKRLAKIVVTAARKLKRKDDLAGLGWFTRKAVSMWIHPYTYTMRGAFSAELPAKQTPKLTPIPTPAADAKAAPLVAPTVVTAKGKWKYAQARE